MMYGFLTFIFLLNFSWGIPLSDDAIRNARKIVIVNGAFDPWSLADQAFAEQLVRSGQADLVIAVPTNSGTPNVPLSVENRLMLMDEALRTNPSVMYPQEAPASVDELVSRIRRISSTPVTQVRVPPSGENIRGFLSQNPDQYFSRNLALSPSGYDSRVYERILQQGFYMGQRPGTGSFVNRAVNWMGSVVIDTGVFDRIKHVVNDLRARPNRREFNTGSETLRLQRPLGAGAQAAAYITQVDGRDVVIKIAKDMNFSREMMWNSVLNHRWLTQTSTIQVPGLIAYDPEGRWITTEFAPGTQLDRFIANNNGQIPPHIEQELRKFYEEAQRISRQNNIVLDINTQNIFVTQEGKLVLVDFGPLPASQRLAATYDDIRALWMTDARRLMSTAQPRLDIDCVKRVLRTRNL